MNRTVSLLSFSSEAEHAGAAARWAPGFSAEARWNAAASGSPAALPVDGAAPPAVRPPGFLRWICFGASICSP